MVGRASFSTVSAYLVIVIIIIIFNQRQNKLVRLFVFNVHTLFIAKMVIKLYGIALQCINLFLKRKLASPYFKLLPLAQIGKREQADGREEVNL